MVSRWSTCWDVSRIKIVSCNLLLQGVGDQLRTIVNLQMNRRWLQRELRHDPVDYLSSPAAPTDLNGQAKEAVLIDHV